jgi:hypothetical protein
MLIDVACHHERFPPMIEPSLSYGLYPWMRSSKQVLSESLDVIAERFTFKPITSSGRGSSSTVRSPLVFSKGRIHKLLIVGAFFTNVPEGSNHITFREEQLSDAQRHFLEIMKEMATENLCLRAEVILLSVWTHEHRPPVGPHVFEGSWDKFWNEKFRQVDIEITGCSSLRTPKDVEVLVQRAKCFARQVAGAGSQEMAVKVFSNERILVKHKV